MSRGGAWQVIARPRLGHGSGYSVEPPLRQVRRGQAQSGARSRQSQRPVDVAARSRSRLRAEAALDRLRPADRLPSAAFVASPDGSRNVTLLHRTSGRHPRDRGIGGARGAPPDPRRSGAGMGGRDPRVRARVALRQGARRSRRARPVAAGRLARVARGGPSAAQPRVPGQRVPVAGRPPARGAQDRCRASAARRRSRPAWARIRRSTPCCRGCRRRGASSWPRSASSCTAGIGWAPRTEAESAGAGQPSAATEGSAGPVALSSPAAGAARSSSNHTQNPRRRRPARVVPQRLDSPSTTTRPCPPKSRGRRRQARRPRSPSRVGHLDADRGRGRR